MEVKTIKGVDEETWKEFKNLAVKNNLKMPLLLKVMIKEFEKKGNEFWKEILDRERNLDETEAKDMLEITNEVRKERGFRE